MSARYDPVIRLHHTGRTIMARFKYDTNLQHLARWVGSTCHDGLLASEVWGIDWRAPRGAEHPETHPHTRDAVVYAECSSRTLAPGLQLCKECNHSALGCASPGVDHLSVGVEHTGLQPFPDQAQKGAVIDTLATSPPAMYGRWGRRSL